MEVYKSMKYPWVSYFIFIAVLSSVPKLNCIVKYELYVNVFSAAWRLECDTAAVSHPLWIWSFCLSAQSGDTGIRMCLIIFSIMKRQIHLTVFCTKLIINVSKTCQIIWLWLLKLTHRFANPSSFLQTPHYIIQS